MRRSLSFTTRYVTLNTRFQKSFTFITKSKTRNFPIFIKHCSKAKKITVFVDFEDL